MHLQFIYSFLLLQSHDSWQGHDGDQVSIHYNSRESTLLCFRSKHAAFFFFFFFFLFCHRLHLESNTSLLVIRFFDSSHSIFFFKQKCYIELRFVGICSVYLHITLHALDKKLETNIRPKWIAHNLLSIS